MPAAATLRRPLDATPSRCSCARQPIPVEELQLPEVHIHILADSSDTWKFHYTLTITLDDGTVLPPFNSNVDGLVGIVLDQDNRNYYGICSEVRGRPRPAPSRSTNRVADRRDDRVQHARRRQEPRHDARHPHRQPPQRDREPGHLGRHRRRPAARRSPTHDDGDNLQAHRSSARVAMRSSCATWSCRSSTSTSRPTRTSGSSTTGSRCSSAGQPYSWTVSGVVLDQDHHKHMGVYSGRPFPTLFYPMAPIAPDGQPLTRNKTISLAFVAQKLDELFNSRQVAGRAGPAQSSSGSSARETFGDQNPPSYSDLQAITNDPPPPDGQPLGPDYRDGYDVFARASRSWAGSRRASASGFTSTTSTPSRSPSRSTRSDDQTPITVELTVRDRRSRGGHRHRRPRHRQVRHHVAADAAVPSATGAVDLFGWVDDIKASRRHDQQAIGTVRRLPDAGHLPGPADRRGDRRPGRLQDRAHRSRWCRSTSTPSRHLDPGRLHPSSTSGTAIFGTVSSQTPIRGTGSRIRDSINAAATSFLIGHVIASGNSELVPYPHPSDADRRSTSQNGVLTPRLRLPGEALPQRQPRRTGRPRPTPGSVGEHRPHRRADAGEPLLRPHARLPQPAAREGRHGRHDVDGLKGDEFNLYNGRKCASFRARGRRHDLLAGTAERARDGGPADQRRQDGRLRPGPGRRVRPGDGAPRHGLPHGRQRADLRRAGARLRRRPPVVLPRIPGPTFPNRFYELSGRPNIDPWGAWEYTNSSPLRAGRSRTRSSST